MRTTRAVMALSLLAALVLVTRPARAGWSLEHPAVTAGGITSQVAGAYSLSAALGQGVTGAATGGSYTLVLGVLAPSGSAAAGVAPPGALPARLAFLPPRPNPARAEVAFGIDLPREAPVRLEVFGVNGRCVAHLVGRTLPAGRHEVRWQATDDSGRPLAPGVYFASLTAASHRLLRRLVLLTRP